jgi:polysulfide reductase-like protein
VVVCPTESILIGNLRDPNSKVSQYVNRDVVAVRRPEKETLPKLFYKGAHQATLDPLAARRPEGGVFMWSEQTQHSSHDVVSGHPGKPNNMASAMLAYDVPHKAPWGLPITAYIWTKAIAAGTYLIGAALFLLGNDAFWKWTTPLISAVFLALTFALLIGELEHPKRFYLILTRPQWRSWLVRGGIILTVFAALLGVHLLWSFLGSSPPRAFAILGILAAVPAGTYTAWLLAQAKARDLWQSPLLPPQHLVACFVAGAAALFLAKAPLAGPILAVATLVHLMLIAAEVLMPHPTAHARLASREMTRGRFRLPFLSGVAMQLIGAGAIVTGIPAALLVLAGLFFYERAHIGAGQSVPLA